MPEITIRNATEADNATLAELERRSPLVFATHELVIDRGQDYFAAARLMEEAAVLVAEVDGTPAGVMCGAIHRAPIGGVERTLVYIHHARIPPEYQRMGLGRRLAGRLREMFAGRGVDSQYWYIAPDNARSQGFASAAANRWSFGPQMLSIETAENGGSWCGRWATATDAEELAAIFNAGHAGEELFAPYTVESLRARMTRAPKQYSWGSVLLGRGAAVGVYREGDWVRTLSRTAEGEDVHPPGAIALDYGCPPGRENELFDLFRCVCAVLAGDGFADLTAFTSPGALLGDHLRALATSIRPLDFWTPDIPEPEGARGHGLYLDPVHF
ncbi:MAG: GNAT family N-acetyltransferase [Dehalococcoidia bacterium]|nr:GNAT family N-acetyltransferase [Dehalococcoidia bacterium]